MDQVEGNKTVRGTKATEYLASDLPALTNEHPYLYSGPTSLAPCIEANRGQKQEAKKEAVTINLQIAIVGGCYITELLRRWENKVKNYLF